MRDEIEHLRTTLPERVPLSTYCDPTRRSRSSAYLDLRRIPSLGLKIGPHTFIDRDTMLAEMTKPAEPWLPLKDRQRCEPGKVAPRRGATPRASS